MIDDRDLIRHLEEGGPELYERPQPPALDLAAITGADAALSPAAEPHARRRATIRLRPLVAVGGAIACLGIGLASGAVLFGSQGDRAPIATASTSEIPARTRQVTLLRYDSQTPLQAMAQANVFTATDGRTVDLRVKGLPLPKKGEFYELWVLGDAGKMVSLGIVRVGADGAAEARMPLPVSLRRFPVFDLSLESTDGNPTHSGHSVLRSPAAA